MCSIQGPAEAVFGDSPLQWAANLVPVSKACKLPGINQACEFGARTAVHFADEAAGTVRGLVTTSTAAREGAPRYVYRGGSNSADNLTPRAQDKTGLSTFDNLDAAVPPGGKAQVIDTTRLRCLIACPDAPPAGHVSIRPRNPFDLQDWMAARGTGTTHPYSQELQDAIVDVVRRPK